MNTSGTCWSCGSPRVPGSDPCAACGAPAEPVGLTSTITRSSLTAGRIAHGTAADYAAVGHGVGPVRRAQRPLVVPTLLASAVGALMAVLSVIAMVMVVSHHREFDEFARAVEAYVRFRSHRPFNRFTHTHANLASQSYFLGLVIAVVVLLNIAAMCWWTYRAYSNLIPSRRSYDLNWAVGSRFVPWIQIYRPATIGTDLCSVSRSGSSWVVFVWWWVRAAAILVVANVAVLAITQSWSVASVARWTTIAMLAVTAVRNLAQIAMVQLVARGQQDLGRHSATMVATAPKFLTATVRRA